jgi:hypothetical protein
MVQSLSSDIFSRLDFHLPSLLQDPSRSVDLCNVVPGLAGAGDLGRVHSKTIDQ